MTDIGREFKTLLSGAAHLLEAGEALAAERLYKDILRAATIHGNEAEQKMAETEWVNFLRTRGRSKESESVLMRFEEKSVPAEEAVQEHEATRDIIVIGSGAGGVEAVCQLLHKLPPDLDAAILLIQQTPGHSPSELADMLNSRSNLHVAIPADGDLLTSGRVYLAPPNQHLMVQGHSILLGNGPKENRARPAIDVLFRTAAHAYGTHVIGVILSGVLNDGTSGLMSIQRHGGKSIVQDTQEAVFDGMPRSAIALTKVDYVLKSAEIGTLLEKLIGEGLGDKEDNQRILTQFKDQSDVGEVGGPGIRNVAPYPPSSLTCPSCGGAVWQLQEQSLTLFKCHTGHSYTAELMLEEQSEAVDATAWTLLRSINEQIELRKRLAEWARNTGRMEEADFHEQQASQAERQSVAFRALLLSSEKGRD